VPLALATFGIGTSGRNGPFYTMYKQQNLKKYINVAGDLQLELHKDVALYHLKTIHFRRYWLFCGIRRKVLKT
jgi:hypothetical protein